MTIWIAKDWYRTMVFITKPKLINNGELKEWYGGREVYLERFIPQKIYDLVKMNKCIECELEVTITKKKKQG